MNHYQPHTDDMHFVLSRVLDGPQQLQALPGFGDIDDDLMRQVLDEAGKFVGDVVAPPNRDGDEIGARWADDYLRACALVLIDGAWLRIEAAPDDDTPDRQARWNAPALALRQWVLPEFAMRAGIVEQQCAAVAG